MKFNRHWVLAAWETYIARAAHDWVALSQSRSCRRGLPMNPVRKQRFEREAKTISGLNHPHICVLYDVGDQDGTDYLVMGRVEGETLAKLLEKGPLPFEQLLK